MKKLTTILLVLFCCAYTQTSDAQANDKLFKSRGYNFQWTTLPIAVSSFGGQINYDNLKQRGVGYSYKLRYNLIQAGDNSSVGLGFGLTAGLEVGINIDYEYLTFGALYAPLELSYNYGAGSTYDSDNDFGFGLGVGLTAAYLPIYSEPDISKIRFSPSLNISIRKFSDGNNSLREYFLRFDKISSELDIPEGESLSAYTITVGTKKIIGY
jgi:hypothetical protein